MRSVAIVVFAVAVFGQEPSFNVESRLVMVPAIVTDAKGRSVDDIEPDEFVVLDNGRRQSVTVDSFATGSAPIALIVAVQSSGISVPALDKVRKIGAMIQPLITGERGCAGLISFAERVHWDQECTKDIDALARAFQWLRPGEEKSARMLDAVHEAIGKLRQRRHARRVLLLISESRDRGSETELEMVLADAQAAGVAVYAATYSAFKTAFTTRGPRSGPVEENPVPKVGRPPGPQSPKGRVDIPPPEQRMDILGGIGELARLGKTKTTEALARGTGGSEFPFTRLKGLENAIENLGEELHSQYVLSFTPADPEPGHHRLEVQVPGRPGLRIRSRPAYWSVQGGRRGGT